MRYYQKLDCYWLHSMYQVLLSQDTLHDLKNYNFPLYSLKHNIQIYSWNNIKD